MRVMRPAAALAGVGVTAAVGVTIAAARASGATAASPISPPGGWRPALIAAVIASFVLYGVGVLLLASPRSRVTPVLAIATAVQLIPLAGPLLLSTDVRLYWVYGHAASEGRNPYVHSPDWPQGSVYGPLFTLLSEPIARATSPGTGEIVFRALAGAGVLAAAVLAAKLSRDSARAAAFVGWNPLLALHSAGGGHNDAIMMAFVLAALALAARERHQSAGGMWAASVFVKWASAPLLAADLVQRHRSRRPLGAVGLAAVSAAILLAAFVRYGPQWLHVFPTLSEQAKRASSIGVLGWLQQLGVAHRAALVCAALLQLAVVGFLLVQAWRRRLRLGLGAGLLVLAQGRLNPWYAVWTVALAAADDEDRAGRWLSIGLTGFLLRDTLPL